MSALAGGGATAAASAPARPPRRAGRGRRPSQSGLVAWLFSAPGLLLLGAFLVAPFALALGFSFTNQRLISPLPTRFVGLDNYTAILTDGTFWKALLNNVWFVLVVVPVQTCFALWLAILVNRQVRGRVLFRTIFFLPVVTVMAAAAVIWTLLYNPDGLVNAVMETVTLGAFAPDWLNSTTWALPAIIVLSIWQGVGFQMIILLAALQDVPDQLYEAAALDGATRWQQFRNVTLPGIRNGLIFVVTVTTILAFRLFDQVWIMPRTPGGPLDSTRTVMLEMVETGFGAQQIGRGAAVAVVFFLIVLLVAMVQRRFVREEGEVS
jgi:multiple sugar transport system permease protein